MQQINKIIILIFFSFTFTNIISYRSNREIFEGKTVLITGGTGFIGRALTKEILKYEPKCIRIFSRDEVKHYDFSRLFCLKNDCSVIVNIVGDVCHYDAVNKACEGVDIVIHAAALKRLDLIEDHIPEAIRTNVLGVHNVVEACENNKIKEALFVSTDKACSPVNVYGACKFIGEKLFANNAYYKKTTKYLVVRYGNVLKSTGSMIPFFLEKIKRGMEIPLTDHRMTRFLIDESRAVKLIFDTLRYGKGGEVFIPRLPSIKIVDLIFLLKEKYNQDIPVKIIGIRPGEKIHEVMVNESELSRTFEFKDYLVIIPSNTSINDTRFLYFKSFPTTFKKEYSSEGAVLSRADLNDLLNRFDVLEKIIRSFLL